MSKKEKPQAASNSSSDGDSIKVFVRVRPSESAENDLDFGQCLQVRLPDTIVMQSKPEPKIFTFDHVTDGNTTQEAVFTAVGKKIIECCVGGYNGTIFAYGQTGSGKTFTMLGPSEDGDNFHHELRGVIPRSFEYLFNLVNREREKHGDRFEFLCRCSFLEIYNEQIFDLLDPASMGLHLRENMKKGVFVDGLIERAVDSPSEAYGVLTAGWLNRRVAATSMNRESSRSHAVFTVSIESKEKKAGVSNIRVSQLHLVDLAGSERQKDTRTTGVRLKEAGSINKSLSILGNVIMALVDIAHGKQRHVPYRDSKLSFLLRDSLGGNAKTYIIANVHPDAKCFGETLSTLKFARRAKMIKNRAVVNEDTQGNILDLQAEIRRLREALAVGGAAGPIPRGPSQAGDGQAPVGASNGIAPGSAGQGESSGKWKKHFLEAMCLRDNIETDKKDLKERVASLEELCSKRDRAIQSNKMIIKFRENTIADLLKTKGKASTPDEKDRIIENMKKEVEQLRDQVEHNPFVMRHVVENQSLRAQNKKLRALEAIRSGSAINAAKAQELEKLFFELREGLSANNKFSITPNSTPTSTPVEGDNVATSTVVILKSQIKKMQEELENAKQEQAEQQEVSRKQKLELEAELASYKKTSLDLEKNLEGLKVKNRLERDAINDMHMQTIKKITTPKKAAYRLRSRLVLRAGGMTPSMEGMGSSPLRSQSASSDISEDGGPSAMSSPNMEATGIADEDMPDEMVEQCTEALTTEVKKLQAKIASQQHQMEEQESEKQKMVQNITKLDHQVEHMNELHSSETKSWSEQERFLTTRIAELSGQLEVIQRDYGLAKSEAEDFRVMLQAVDKDLSEEKKLKRNVEQDWHRVKAALDAQVVRLENDLCNRARELDTITEDREQLQDTYNTLQAEYGFQQQREAELENRLKSKKAEVSQLQEEIQGHLEKIDSECEKNKRLTTELRQQGDSTKQELLAAEEQIDQLRDERKELFERMDEEVQKVCETKESLDAANTVIGTMRRTEAEQKEALSSLMGALQEQKGVVKEREEEIANLHMRLEDSRGQASLLERALDDTKAQTNALQMQIEAMEDRLRLQANDHQQQIEEMRAEAMDVGRQHKELLREMEKQSEEMGHLHAQVKEKEEELERKESEHKTTMEALEKRESEYKTSIASLETQLEEAKTNLSTVMVEFNENDNDQGPDAKRRRLTSDLQAQELESLAEHQSKFNELFKDFEALRDETDEQRNLLAIKEEELDEIRNSKEILKAQHQKLEYEHEALKFELEVLNEDLKQREIQLREQTELLQRDNDRQQKALEGAIQEKKESVTELQKLQIELDQVKANEEILQENMDQVQEELDRVTEMEAKSFSEREALKSKLEEELEQKTKLSKEVNVLREKNEELAVENADLVSHNNHKQKIKYHMQVKVENQQLKEQLTKAKIDNEKVRREFETLNKRLGQLEGTGQGARHPPPPRVPEPFKENSDPEMSSSS